MIFAVAREAGGLCRLRIEFSAAEVAGVFAEDADPVTERYSDSWHGRRPYEEK